VTLSRVHIILTSDLPTLYGPLSVSTFLSPYTILCLLCCSMGLPKSYDIKNVLSHSRVLCEARLLRGLFYSRLLNSFFHRSLSRLICQSTSLDVSAGSWTACISLPHALIQIEGHGVAQHPTVAMFRALVDAAHRWCSYLERSAGYRSYRFSPLLKESPCDFRSMVMPTFVEFILKDSLTRKRDRTMGLGYNPLLRRRVRKKPLNARIDFRCGSAATPCVQPKSAIVVGVEPDKTVVLSVRDPGIPPPVFALRADADAPTCFFEPGTMCVFTGVVHRSTVQESWHAHRVLFCRTVDESSAMYARYKRCHGASFGYETFSYHYSPEVHYVVNHPFVDYRIDVPPLESFTREEVHSYRDFVPYIVNHDFISMYLVGDSTTPDIDTTQALSEVDDILALMGLDPVDP